MLTFFALVIVTAQSYSHSFRIKVTSLHAILLKQLGYILMYHINYLSMPNQPIVTVLFYIHLACHRLAVDSARSNQQNKARALSQRLSSVTQPQHDI